MAFNTIIYWRIPPEIQEEIDQARSQGLPDPYIGVNLYRSQFEDGDYTKLNTDPIPLSRTEYEDVQVPVSSKDGFYYLVRFVRPDNSETIYYLAYTKPSPRELRLCTLLRNMLSPFLSSMLTDDDILAGLQLGLRAFNLYPPQTSFTIANLPSDLEPLVLMMSAMFAFIQRYVPVAITDLSYSDNGLSLSIDRGTKVKTAIDMINAFVDKYILPYKWNYAPMGSGFGTIPIPLSLGGKMTAQILNILDIFNVTGR
jgi:hypothetical protein